MPLAEKLRPTSLKEVVGQEHLTAKGKLLENMVSSNRPFSLIFWGPPGSGKTTLARIIAKEIKAYFVELSAVTASKKDIMNIVETAQANRRLGQKTILFVDEIHRFNKAQQDAFLPYVEDGTIILIGATTENPSFEVISALLSRCRVLTLEPLAKKDIVTIIKKALKRLTQNIHPVSRQTIDMIAELSGGDGRTALNLLEISLNLSGNKPLDPELIKAAAQNQLPLHDKAGESHYNLASAFIKSLRGGSVDASLYYLARLLIGGDDPKFIARRMVIFASEDIGMAAPAALNIAISTFQAVERIGMPECRYNLFHCAIVLAKAPKSRAVAEAMDSALSAAQQYPNLAVPLQLRNAPTHLMRELGYNKNYQWQAGFKPTNGFMPPEIDNLKFFND